MKNKLSTKYLLKVIGDEWRSNIYIIKELNIIQMLEARKLQLKLRDLLRKGKVVRKVINGKSHWKVKN